MHHVAVLDDVGLSFRAQLARLARPGLALLLAVLAIPGTTVAWALPLGGLWIGVPLAVAAIVVLTGVNLGGITRTAGLTRILVSVVLLILAVALVPIGGLCAAGDAAITMVSRARVEEMARDGRRSAGSLMRILSDRPRYTNLLLLLRVHNRDNRRMADLQCGLDFSILDLCELDLPTVQRVR